jgi:hypothetical protein
VCDIECDQVQQLPSTYTMSRKDIYIKKERFSFFVSLAVDFKVK